MRTGLPARRVEAVDGGYRVTTDVDALEATVLVLAVPADVVATLLAPLTKGRSEAFAEVPYAPLAIVTLGYARARVGHPLDGFGFLAPRCESLRILGCLFPSSLFEGRAPADHVALTAFAGGRTDPEIVGFDDDRLLAVVGRDLGRALGVEGQPAHVGIRRWPRAIPQYEIGHGRFVELRRAIEAAHPGLHLTGNVWGGVSVADCVGNATELAGRIAQASPGGHP